MGQVRGVTHRQTHLLSPELAGEFFEVTTKDDRSYVGIEFNQKLPDGGRREFRTDLERVEFIEKQAAEYAKSGATDQRLGQAGDTLFRFKRGSDSDVTVQLMQKARDGSELWQGLKTDAKTLKSAVGEGKNLEGELGLEQRWHVLVDARTLTKDENGRITAQVLESFTNGVEARDRLDRSGGNLALSTEPQRRGFGRGESVELFSDGGMLLKGRRESQTVEQQLGEAEFVRGREGTQYVLARWDDKYNEPKMDGRVKFDGTGFEAASLKPEDYRAGYNPGRERGEAGEPKWVLIEKDSQKFGAGNIRGISNDRAKLVGELAGLERLNEIERAVGKDWNKQSFGMDRNEHTRGYPM